VWNPRDNRIDTSGRRLEPLPTYLKKLRDGPRETGNVVEKRLSAMKPNSFKGEKKVNSARRGGIRTSVWEVNGESLSKSGKWVFSNGRVFGRRRGAGTSKT